MVIMNDGKAETCVMAQGSSTVDVMGTEAAMRAVRVWEVEVNIETLSDHKYIISNVDRIERGNSVTRGINFPRWNTKNLDKDWFAASVVGGDWLAEQRIRNLLDGGEIDKAEITLKRNITDACDNAMKRERDGAKRNTKVYWWNSELAEIRGKCNMWRRRLTRAKRRKSPGRASQLAGELKNNRRELRKAIEKAKKEA